MNRLFVSKNPIKAICLLLLLSIGLCSPKTISAKPVVIMPLGDSVTNGYDGGTPFEDRNGYRKYLRELLIEAGYEVDFVGSLQSGTFTDKQHEGHGGWTDDQIEAEVYNFLNFLVTNPPEIVLLHIGTNNIDIATDAGYSYTDPTNVNDILDQIDLWENANNKTIIVIVARIINRTGHVCPDPSMTTTFNDNVENSVLNRINDRVFMVDMECSAGLNYNLDLVDIVHPNQTGYDKMAVKWFLGGLLQILPVSDAGLDQTVTKGDNVILDGSNSSDPDGTTFKAVQWSQFTGPAVGEISTPTDLMAGFTAPDVEGNGVVLEFKLTVTDDDDFTHEDIIKVTVNQPQCMGGLDPDNDVDGIDLAAYATDTSQIELVDFAKNYGRIDCP